jgi:hypothetical protein
VPFIAGVRDQLGFDFSFPGIVVGLLALDAQKLFGQDLAVVCEGGLRLCGCPDHGRSVR